MYADDSKVIAEVEEINVKSKLLSDICRIKDWWDIWSRCEQRWFKQASAISSNWSQQCASKDEI